MLTSVLGIASKIFKRGPSGPSPYPDGVVVATTAPPSSTTQEEALKSCILASPLLAPCQLTPTSIAADLPRWEMLGRRIAANLELPPTFAELSMQQRERIYQYYLPVYFWVLAQLQKHKNSSSGPLVVGISAPQGCGKSTLCEQLEALLLADGLTPASLSIDDFYLTRAEQEALAAAHPQNPLLQSRGNAASHDLAIGTRTLAALRDATAASAPVALPRYDKSAFQGKGDRADPATWPNVKGPVDVVLFEGWMLGFTPVSEDAAITVDPHLAPVNEALLAYKAAWDSYVDAWLVVRVSDPQFAYRWRLQAEHVMRAAGRDAMTDDEVAAFVDRFMPAYRCYLPGLYADGPTTAQPGALLVVEVDEGRSPAAVQPTPIV